MIIALVLTMLCCIVLGMGVPTTANYCIMAGHLRPHPDGPLHRRHQMAAHFFVFYFGIVADITPPVALAAYAGQRHRQGGPHEDGIQRHKAGHCGLHRAVYLRLQSPDAVCGCDRRLPGGCRSASAPLLGIFGVAAALNGFLYRPVPVLLRLLLAIGGLGMMIPGTASDIAGFVLVVGIVLYQRYSARRTAAA